jgi:predicted small integral membrane protein
VFSVVYCFSTTEGTKVFVSLRSLWFIVFQPQRAQRFLYLCVLCGLLFFNHRGHKGFCISAFSVVYLFSTTEGTKVFVSLLSLWFIVFQPQRALRFLYLCFLFGLFVFNHRGHKGFCISAFSVVYLFSTTEGTKVFVSLRSLWFIVFQPQRAQRFLYLCVLCGLLFFNHRGHKGFCISAFSVVYCFSTTEGTKVFVSLRSLWFIVFQPQRAQRFLYLCVLCGLLFFNHRGHKGFCISAFSVVYCFSTTEGTKVFVSLRSLWFIVFQPQRAQRFLYLCVLCGLLFFNHRGHKGFCISAFSVVYCFSTTEGTKVFVSLRSLWFIVFQPQRAQRLLYLCGLSVFKQRRHNRNQVHKKTSIHHAGFLFEIYFIYFFRILNSTLRFCCLPSSVLLLATGVVSP